MNGRRTAIGAVGTALPETRVAQDDAAERMIEFASLDGASAQWTRRLFRRAGVSERRTVLGGVRRGETPFGGVRRPGTAARMALFREHAGPLAAAAARNALDADAVHPSRVTHLVVVTCTGLHAPGIDVELVERLRLSRDVDRTVVGFMGCYGAFAGLRVARLAVEADAAAVVLVVCVELCSLHVRADAAPDSLVASSLFGDGAAAALVRAASSDAPSMFDLGPAATRVIPDSGAMMGWTVGDDGFEMTLSAELPRAIGAGIAEFVSSFAERSSVEAWCIHPGGPAILAAARDALRLGDEALADSYGVLRDIGNVSSATILFVLERAAARLGPGAGGVALGFGPGLTCEGFTFTRGSRRSALHHGPAPDAAPSFA